MDPAPPPGQETGPTARGARLLENERTILTLGAVNTAAALTVLAGLFIILRPRSGPAIAIDELWEVEAWNGLLPPAGLIYLLIGVLSAVWVAYPATYLLGRICAVRLPRVDHLRLVRYILAGLVILVLLFNGPLGLLVLVTATALGLVAPLARLRRSHAMGVLLVPLLLVLSGLEP